MRLRWITMLCTLTLKLALIGAILLLGRYVLRDNYARIEREHIEADVAHLCMLLQSQFQELDAIALDYSAWDETYNFMRSPSRKYEESDISNAAFKARDVTLLIMLDESGHVRLQRNFDTPRPAIAADIDQLIRASRRRPNVGAAVLGLVTLTQTPAMVSIRPILPTSGKAVPRGSLILVRELGVSQTAALARLAGVPVILSGTVRESSQTNFASTLKYREISTVIINEDRLFAYTTVNDIWRQPSITLQIEHSRGIWNQGNQAIRVLLMVLIAVGLLFAFANMWMMQHFVVRRVEKLIQLTSDTESDAGLNARVEVSGHDELAKLGLKMNEMLQRLQNSQDKLLAVQERLRYEATHDSLTGIWNRCAAMQLLDHELDRASRDGTDVAVIMLDADHFKRINDHFGHSAGDRALQAIAAAITRNLRSFDVCCRYGGEEFLIIAPKCDLDQGQHLATRIAASVRNTPIVVPDHAFCLTLSAGVTSGRAPVKAEDLIVIADRALYRAKDKGRDCVQVEPFPAAKSATAARFAPGCAALPAPLQRSSG